MEVARQPRYLNLMFRYLGCLYKTGIVLIKITYPIHSNSFTFTSPKAASNLSLVHFPSIVYDILTAYCLECPQLFGKLMVHCTFGICLSILDIV